MKTRKTIQRVIFLSLSFIVGVSQVSAQQSQRVLEEILVTAEKRSQSVQDISLSVTALSGNDLDKLHVSSPEDLNGLVPGLTITKSEGFRKIVTIRGLGLESSQNDVANPSVSYHVDGAYIASDLSLNTDFIDVERVEVLRGPQGTVFGQNSTGGTINVISAKPDLEAFSGKADLTLGSDSTVKARGSVNVPVSENSALRAAVTYYKRDGYAENSVIPGFELDEADNITARLQWLWQPNDTFSAIIRAQYFERDGNGSAQRNILDPNTSVRRVAHDFEDKFAFESNIFSATLQWDLDGVTLKSITSYQDESERSSRDNDRLPIARSIVPTTGRAPEAFTQEINLVSNNDDAKFDWILGAFYLDSEQSVDFIEFVDFSGDGVISQDVNLGNPFSTELSFQTASLHERESYSAYAQGTFHLSDTLRAIAGLRYTKDKFSSRVCNFFCDDTFVDPLFVTDSGDATTGKLGLEWNVSEDSLLYATYSRGFKPGGSNLSFAEIVQPTYEAESIDAYELGSKNTFSEGRLQLNLAAFYYDYENFQFQTSDPVPFSGGVDNLPESESYGLELELSALPSDNLRIDANFAYLKTEITSDFFALDPVVAQALQDAAGLGPFDPGAADARRPALRNIRGNSLPKTPELSANIIMSYNSDLGTSGFLTSRLHYVYRDDFIFRVFDNTALDTVPSYDLWNLSFLWEPNESDWNLEFIVTNLTDEDVVNSRFSDNFGVNTTSEEFIAPRQILLRAGIEF